MSEFAADGRRIIDPPCALGHTRQAMECPACSERITGERASNEWWEWHRRRYRKAHAAVAAAEDAG